MKKIIAVVFSLLCVIAVGQEIKFTESTGDELTSSAPLVPLFGQKEVYVSFFTFLGEADQMKMELKYDDTDPANIYPVSFSIPDGSGNEIMIRDYMFQNSLSEISYYSLIEEGIQNYFSKMTNAKLDLDIKFLENPNHPKGVWEVDNPRSYYQMLTQLYGTGESVYRGHMIDRLKDCGDEEIMGIVAPQGTDKETVFLNFMAEPITPMANGTSPGGLAPGNDSYTWVGKAISQNIAILTHELAHTCFAIGDNGFDSGASYFNGYIDGVYTGRSGSQTGPYCLMHHNQITFGPYSLYGIHSVHTQSLYHQGYFDSSEYEILEEEFSNYNEQNKATIKLKSVHDQLTTNDMSEGVKRLVILPVGTDNNESNDNPAIGTMTEAQHFLVEYRNGKGHDNIACLNESGNSEGVLISHIINSDAVGSNYKPCIDIEIANPYPKYWSNGEDLYRNPDSTSSIQSYNGKYYNGKDCPDWLDDYNYNDYPPQGGMGAWPYPFGEHSLPSDFFNDSDRNKFTPSTRPSTCSWKMKDTHIGVYVDNIDYENDYADITVYRNYWSLPLTEEYLAVNNEGKSVVGLQDYCYFGENFSVDPGIQIWLGNGTEEMKATLVPGTDMVMKDNSLLMLANNTVLRLEDSKLTFLSGSKYQPNDVAVIELIDSELNFNDGFVFCPLGEETLNRFDINVSGNSSVYNADLELINSSMLTLNENSKFVIKSGTNFNLSPEAVIILKNGSELVIEEGANINIPQEAQIIVEGNAKITGDLGQCMAEFTINENSQLTFGEGSYIVPQQSNPFIFAGVNSSVNLEKGARLYLGELFHNYFTEGSFISVQNGGKLSAYKSTFDSNEKWQGIKAEIGSEVLLTSAKINNAYWALDATAAHISVIGTSFYNCKNGLSMVNCSNYIVQENNFSGRSEEIGVGIRLTASNGKINNNTVKNYGHGVVITLCSPYISKNIIRDNFENGLYLTGSNTYPQMIDPLEGDVIQNNLLISNGLSNTNDKNAQIRLIYPANVYMYNGLNNIYAEVGDSPAIKAESNLNPNNQMKSITNPIVRIPAINNYWGENQIIDTNYNYIFDLWRTLSEGYALTYEPYADSPFDDNDGPPLETMYSSLTTEGKLLAQAISAEFDGKIDLAIKKYEHIIKKYPASEENYIAVTRLTDLYTIQEEPVEKLMSIYDENIESSDDTVNKKFYKEMKVSANLKNKKYDEAISLAEDLKAQAQTENDILLAEIDIAIANKMKNAQNQKGGNHDNSASIAELLDRLTGNDDKTDPASITQDVLPTETKLYSNYPNPFNPVTQIRFALAKTAEVKLSVYNVNGQKLAKLTNSVMNAGVHSVEFDGSKFNSGVYYYTLEAEGRTFTQKMILMK